MIPRDTYQSARRFVQPTRRVLLVNLAMSVLYEKKTMGADDRLFRSIGVSRCIKQDGREEENRYASGRRAVRGRRWRLVPQLEQAVDEKGDAEHAQKTADREAFVGAAAEADQDHQAHTDAD